MTFVFAKNQLPGFAKGLASNESIAPLASDAVKVAQLRNVVKKELTKLRLLAKWDIQSARIVKRSN